MRYKTFYFKILDTKIERMTDRGRPRYAYLRHVKKKAVVIRLAEGKVDSTNILKY